MFKKTDKPPVPLLSPVRSTLRDTLRWSWTEVEPRDKNGKNVCVDYLMKWDWSHKRNEDDEWEVGGWLVTFKPLYFQDANVPTSRTVFLRFASAAREVGAFLLSWRPTNRLNHPTLSEKNNIQGHSNFWLKSLTFYLSFIFLLKAKQLVFQSFKPILPSAAPSFSHHVCHCHHDSLQGIKFTSHFHPWF